MSLLYDNSITIHNTSGRLVLEAEVEEDKKEEEKNKKTRETAIKNAHETALCPVLSGCQREIVGRKRLNDIVDEDGNVVDEGDDQDDLMKEKNKREQLLV